MAQSGRPGSRYKVVRRVNRVSKRAHKCHIIQKRDDHIVQAKIAARMVCAALKHGATKASVDREVQNRCGVGQPECDCERILLLLRQLIAISASVAIALAVVNALVVVIPFLIGRIPLLGTIIGRIAAGTVLRRITDETKTIEGVFFRVRDTAAEIERAIGARTL